MSIWLEYVHYIPNLLKPNDNTADNLPLQWAVTGLLSRWVELENWIRPICEQIIQTTFMNWKNWFIDSFFSYELSWTHEVKPWWMSRFSVNNNLKFNLFTSNLMVLLCIFWLDIALDTIQFHYPEMRYSSKKNPLLCATEEQMLNGFEIFFKRL